SPRLPDRNRLLQGKVDVVDTRPPHVIAARFQSNASGQRNRERGSIDLSVRVTGVARAAGANYSYASAFGKRAGQVLVLNARDIEPDSVWRAAQIRKGAGNLPVIAHHAKNSVLAR